MSVTRLQYEEAKKIVREYEDAMYEQELHDVRHRFPVGCGVSSQNDWTRGTVYGYGRQQNSVTLKIKQSECKGFCLAKYAKHIN